MSNIRKLGSALAAGTAAAMTHSAHADDRYLPKDPKNIRVGWVGTGPFSFYGHYIAVMHGTGGDYNPMNMRVTHIWGDDYSKNYKGSDEWVKKMLDFWASEKQSPEGIAKREGIPNVCNDFREMVDDVDAAMIMDFDRADVLSEPFLRQGKPVFLCSPVAVNVPTCEKILSLAKANNAAVFTGSFTAGMYDNQSAAGRVRKNRIRSFFASTWHHFFTSYANDGLEPVHWVMGGGVRKVQLVGWNGSGGYDPDGIPLSRIHLEYEPREDAPPIQGALTLGGFKKEGMWFRVAYQDNTVFESFTNSGGRAGSFRDFLLQLQETFAINKSPETHEDIIEKLKVVIASYKSANEGNRPVSLDEVGDYRMPTVRIEHWDQIPN